MRCSGWSSLAISACSGVAAALVLAAPAAAHVVATPTFLASKSSESIGFEAPNERNGLLELRFSPGVRGYAFTFG